MINTYTETSKIRGIRASCKIASKVMKLITQEIKFGVTTLYLDSVAEKAMSDFGVRSAFRGYRGFPGSICISVNEEIVHGIPSESKIISQGDMVKIDMGVILNGYYSDMATTILIDDGSENSVANRHLMDANLSALMAGISAARPKSIVAAISSAIYKVLQDKGYEPIDDLCGHGVGIHLHEPPAIPNKIEGWNCSPVLKSGMTIAIEPMVALGTSKARIANDGWTLVTDNGKSASHFEHTILITDGEPEILTL